MTPLFRRLSIALVAATLVAAVATDDAFAQGATVGPAGGIPSTTAPSNGQGTPSGGTGTLSTTRVGPATTATMPTATTAAPRSTTHRRRHHHRRHHRARAHAPAN